VPTESAPILYIRLRKRLRLPKGADIRLGQIAEFLTEPEYEGPLEGLLLYRTVSGDGDMVLVDMMQIAAKVKEKFPHMQIEHFGEPHTLVELVSPAKRPHFVLFAAVWILLFIGSGLAIMNFHADVSMMEVHRRIYELVTGKRADHPWILQIPYSIGIGAGMVIFFNHLFKKKFNEEPSPLEVEMFMYEENVSRYVITDEYSKLHGKKMKRP
jgi:stage V sporulation protein AA